MDNGIPTRRLIIGLIALIVAANLLNAVAQPSSGRVDSSAPRWSVQVAQIDPASVNIDPSFLAAIYESSLAEIGKTNQFNHLFRDGDRTARNVPNLLVLKTTVEKFVPGSETQRAVTTVSGATKLTVRIQLCTRKGQVVLERTVTGNVRFMGSNLKATHNLARNVAKTIKNSSLPTPASPQAQGGQL